MSGAILQGRSGIRRVWMVAISLCLLAPPAFARSSARERAIGQIPELMGRILESQNEIRELEAESSPVVNSYEQQLEDARRRITEADGGTSADEALVDYVENYAALLDTREGLLEAIGGPVARMRADARELSQAAAFANQEPKERREERERLMQEQYQGMASAMQQLSNRLGREEEAATAGEVLRAGWDSQTVLELPLRELGADGARVFAQRVEGLHARHRARTNQLKRERRSVQRLLDVLIERQLAERLGQMFAGGAGLGDLLAAGGESANWQDLSQVVNRVMGLPGRPGTGAFSSNDSLAELDYFARGGHRGRP